MRETEGNKKEGQGRKRKGEQTSPHIQGITLHLYRMFQQIRNVGHFY